jgi:hypothetical protein
MEQLWNENKEEKLMKPGPDDFRRS